MKRPEHDYILGQWAAFDRVLDLLNTFDEKLVDKAVLYKAIHLLRPEPKSDVQ